MSLLKVENLTTSYGKVEALRDISFTINAGEIVTVIGANGAGKSTLVLSLMGVLPSKGAIAFNGEPLTYKSIEERVSMGLSLVPEKRELFTSLSVMDNLELGGYLCSRSERNTRYEEVFTRFPRLKERREQLAGTLSGGERQMLALGRALMSKPKLLMLDEPSLGLAPLIVRDIFTIITDLNKAGTAILLIEQNAKMALSIAHKAHVMELGEFTMSGDASTLAKDERIANIYLGGH